MSTTRYAKDGADPDASPERFLANGKLRGINIGLNVICRIARIRTPEERGCMIWLHNYARLQNLTADALSDELDLSKPDIRAALTDPDVDLARFVRQVKTVRTKFEKSLVDLADIEPTSIVRQAMSMALKKKKIVDVVGLTRIGKTAPAVDWFKRNAMHCGIMFNCPSDETDRNFYCEWARSMGINTSTSKKNADIIPQIRGCLGAGMIELIIVDEGHFLCPADTNSKPKRLEALRSAYDMKTPAQIGIVNLTTPQSTIYVNTALKKNPRWAPGQWVGRAVPFHLPDIVSDEDLMAVAEHHAPDFTKGMREALVLHGKSSHGYCGAMVNVIDLARFLAEDAGAKKVTPDILFKAQEQSIKGTEIEQLMKLEAAKKKRGEKIVELKGAAA